MVVFQILYLISIGVVYLGTWRHQEVAIKKLKQNNNLSAAQYEEFSREASIMKSLRPHKNGNLFCEILHT